MFERLIPHGRALRGAGSTSHTVYMFNRVLHFEKMFKRTFGDPGTPTRMQPVKLNETRTFAAATARNASIAEQPSYLCLLHDDIMLSW